jgi:hypothetical protein
VYADCNNQAHFSRHPPDAQTLTSYTIDEDIFGVVSCGFVEEISDSASLAVVSTNEPGGGGLFTMYFGSDTDTPEVSKVTVSGNLVLPPGATVGGRFLARIDNQIFLAPQSIGLFGARIHADKIFYGVMTFDNTTYKGEVEYREFAPLVAQDNSMESTCGAEFYAGTISWLPPLCDTSDTEAAAFSLQNVAPRTRCQRNEFAFGEAKKYQDVTKPVHQVFFVPSCATRMLLCSVNQTGSNCDFERGPVLPLDLRNTAAPKRPGLTKKFRRNQVYAAQKFNATSDEVVIITEQKAFRFSMLLKMHELSSVVSWGCKQGIAHPAITKGDDDDTIRVYAICQSGKPFTKVTFRQRPGVTSNSSFLQGSHYGMPEVRRMSDYSSDTIAFLDMQAADTGDSSGLLLRGPGTITPSSSAEDSCSLALIDDALETSNATLVALEAHIQSLGMSMDRLFITNYWMSKQYTFFADLNSWLTGSNTQLGKQIARVEDWILSMYQSLAFQLEYKTMMAKISVGNEFTEITGMKWMNRRLAILINTLRKDLCADASKIKYDNNGAPTLYNLNDANILEGDWLVNSSAVSATVSNAQAAFVTKFGNAASLIAMYINGDGSEVQAGDFTGSGAGGPGTAAGIRGAIQTIMATTKLNVKSVFKANLQNMRDMTTDAQMNYMSSLKRRSGFMKLMTMMSVFNSSDVTGPWGEFCIKCTETVQPFTWYGVPGYIPGGNPVYKNVES